MTTNTHELIEALEKADERASVKIMVKDYADGWYELKVSRRPNVEQLRQALAIQPQAEAQPGVGELRQLDLKAREIFGLIGDHWSDHQLLELMTADHPQLGMSVAAALMTGRADDVLKMLKRLDSGAYL